MEPTKLRIIELRRELSERNLETSGKKIELISRLQFALDEERRLLQSNDVDSSKSEQIQSENISPQSDEINISNNSSNDIVSAANDIVSSYSNETAAAIDSAQSVEHNLIEIRETDSSITENNEENRASDNDVTADLKNVTYTLMPGKRTNSEILYSKEEQQFYVKKKKLANGVISLVCRTKGCKNHCYLDLKKGICSLPVPYVPHTHATKEEEFKSLCVLNQIKSDCTNPNTVAKTETKTSVVKSIFKDTITENEDSTIQYHRIERTLRRIAS